MTRFNCNKVGFRNVTSHTPLGVGTKRVQGTVFRSFPNNGRVAFVKLVEESKVENFLLSVKKPLHRLLLSEIIEVIRKKPVISVADLQVEVITKLKKQDSEKHYPYSMICPLYYRALREGIVKQSN